MWEFNWGVFWAVLAAGVILFPLWTIPLQNKLDLVWHKLDAFQAGVENEITSNRTEIVQAIDAQTTGIKDEIIEIGNKLPD